MMPKVSIIIPIYNINKYIKKALDSVINQILEDIEIICINDCTPDNSFEIVKKYAAKDSRFILLESEIIEKQTSHHFTKKLKNEQFLKK